ncbi:MAG: helicase-related protein, partial [Burkholderiales bacterium]
HLLRSRDMRQALVFVRMKRDANRLARQLQHDGVVAKEIHSDRTQAERMQALDEFKQGKVPVLVATDIAARGLDIEELPFVINFELPHTAEDYVHRIGRTARAGLPGEAISLVSPDEMKYLEDIERLLKRKLPRAVAPESLAESRHPSRPRETHRERGAPHRQSKPHHEPTTHHPPKAQHPPKPQPAARTSPHGFDYTKPYEPSSPKPAPNPATAPATHKGHHRPTAALLGGGPGKREPHK